MTSLKRYVRREIIAREKEFVARVISDPRMLDFDESADGSPVWVVDLDIGGNRPVRNVPIKGGTSGGRFYAQLTQTVKVRRTALGRMFIIGPGDVSIATLNTTEYALDTLAEGATSSTEFIRLFQPFEFYQGPTAMKGNPSVTFAVEAGDDSITRDAGSWLDDGFAVSDTIVVQESSSNDGDLTVTGVTDLVLTVSETLFNEGPTQPVAIGVALSSRWADGLTSFPFSQVVDANGDPV